MLERLNLEGLREEIKRLERFGKLKTREIRFAQEYVGGKNPAQAAKAAGYKSSGNLLERPQVAKYIRKLLEVKERECIMGRQEAMKHLTTIARSNIGNIVSDVQNAGISVQDWRSLCDNVKYGVAGVKPTKFGVEIKMMDKLDALKEILKFYQTKDAVSETADQAEIDESLEAKISDFIEKNGG